MIEDSENKSRAKLKSMPNGTWATRQYVTTLDRKRENQWRGNSSAP